MHFETNVAPGLASLTCKPNAPVRFFMKRGYWIKSGVPYMDLATINAEVIISNLDILPMNAAIRMEGHSRPWYPALIFRPAKPHQSIYTVEWPTIVELHKNNPSRHATQYDNRS